MDLDKEREELMRSELSKRAMDTIIKHGHTVNYIFPTPENPGTPFGYTVGRTLKGRPELFIVGPLPPEVMQGILNTAAKADDEDPLRAGEERHDILVGYGARIIEADPEAAQMNQALSFFGDDVTALQILWPDAEGFFPGDEPYAEAHDPGMQPTYPLHEPVDTSSSASRQHYIDTGSYLNEGEAL